MRILYLVPTRGRPANAARLVEQWRQTTDGETHLQLCLDDDDPELPGYREALLGETRLRDNVSVTVDPRRRLGPTLNHYAVQRAPACDAVGFMGDDHLPLQPGWDQELAGSLRPWGVVYGNDLVHGPNIPTAALLDARLVRSMGFMVPPGLVHMYLDNFWKELGASLGTLVYRGDVVIEHLHPIVGKAPWDDRYREVNAGEVYASDKAWFDQFMASHTWANVLARLKWEQANTP